LQSAGINQPELKKTLAAHGAQIDAILARNNAEAHSLGMRGTPGLLVGPMTRRPQQACYAHEVSAGVECISVLPMSYRP
jgi:protein-disulfide isomerase